MFKDNPIPSIGLFLFISFIVLTPVYTVYYIVESSYDGYQKMRTEEVNKRQQICDTLRSETATHTDFERCIDPKFFAEYKIEYLVIKEREKYRKMNNAVKNLNQHRVDIDTNSYRLVTKEALYDLGKFKEGEKIKFKTDVDFLHNDDAGRYKGQIIVYFDALLSGYFVNRAIESKFLHIVYPPFNETGEYFLYWFFKQSLVNKDLVYATIVDTKDQWPEGMDSRFTKILSVDNIDFAKITFPEIKYRNGLKNSSSDKDLSID